MQSLKLELSEAVWTFADIGLEHWTYYGQISSNLEYKSSSVDTNGKVDVDIVGKVKDNLKAFKLNAQSEILCNITRNTVRNKIGFFLASNAILKTVCF